MSEGESEDVSDEHAIHRTCQRISEMKACQRIHYVRSAIRRHVRLSINYVRSTIRRHVRVSIMSDQRLEGMSEYQLCQISD